jgi:hypothetical protein
MYVPQPEVPADDTNPRGFGEPQWVVDFHTQILQRLRVQVSDARPRAWFLTAKASAREQNRDLVHEWLSSHLDRASELVVKDPRLAWFLPLWQSSAIRYGAKPSFVTMLRPPAEVVGSKQIYYGGRTDDLNRTAAWLNMMLHTERATRGSQRAFVRYHDLLDDWTTPVFRVGETLDLQAVRDADFGAIRRVHRLVDPALHRVRQTLDDVDLPAQLRELTEETWRSLDSLADPGADTTAAHTDLDALRLAYIKLYEEAEGIAMSSVLMARPPRPRQAPAVSEGADLSVESEVSVSHDTRPEAATSRLRESDSGREVSLSHRVRAAIPVSWRRAFRRVVPRRDSAP